MTTQLLSTSGAARELGVSVPWLQKLERRGLIPPAMRLEGSQRRVYTAEMVERIREIRAERGAGKAAAQVPPEVVEAAR